MGAYRNLIFKEVSNEKTQAALPLDCGYNVQVTFDRDERVHDCNLWDSKGNNVDREEGLDRIGVDEFIEQSIKLVEMYKEDMVMA